MKKHSFNCKTSPNLFDIVWETDRWGGKGYWWGDYYYYSRILVLHKTFVVVFPLKTADIKLVRLSKSEKIHVQIFLTFKLFLHWLLLVFFLFLFLDMRLFFSTPFYFCSIWAVAATKSIKNSFYLLQLMPGYLIYSTCHWLWVMTSLDDSKTKRNKTNNWPTNDKKGGYLVTIRKHWSWQLLDLLLGSP